MGKQWLFANPKPDWRQYRPQDSPAMVQHLIKCKELGLKPDPWARNYVWCMARRELNWRQYKFWKIYLLGFWPGLGLTVSCVLIDKLFGISEKKYGDEFKHH